MQQALHLPWQDQLAFDSEITMDHLRNILDGIAAAMNPFGTAPLYRYPKLGERQMDLRKVGGDFAPVISRLHNNSIKAIEQVHGKPVNNRACKG